MGMEDEKAYQYWLHNLPEVGDRTIEILLGAFGSARQIYKADLRELKQVINVRNCLLYTSDAADE